MENNIVLQEIINYYLQSQDFNGLPIYRMENYNKEVLFKLIDNDFIEVISEREVLNPHIRGFSLNIPKKIQKENVSDKKSHSCLYPSEKALEDIEVDYNRPYTTLMQKGKEQFDIIFFNIEILERYINNPKFVIMDGGYRGTIYMHDEYEEEDNSDYIKDYGMAYSDGEVFKRAVGVFLIDLTNLSPKIQMLWKAFELDNQDNYKINSGFVRNLIYGEWTTDYWIFHALIDEMKIINKQCQTMEINPLFSQTYGTHYSEIPEGYRNILLPTMKNYYDFVLVLEKMFVHNISIKAFQKDSFLIEKIDRRNEKGEIKGSLTMLSEWLNKNIKTYISIDETIISPLKKIRKIRQIPAHQLTDNSFDVSLYNKQNELVIETYKSIRFIRLLFSNHPATESIKIPDYLFTGENIVIH